MKGKSTGDMFTKHKEHRVTDRLQANEKRRGTHLIIAFLDLIVAAAIICAQMAYHQP
jgi:hypothetical protein